MRLLRVVSTLALSIDPRNDNAKGDLCFASRFDHAWDGTRSFGVRQLPSPRNEAGTLTHIRLPMGYIANIQFAPFYVAIQKGYFRDAGIEIEFDYKFETDGVKLGGLRRIAVCDCVGRTGFVGACPGIACHLCRRLVSTVSCLGGGEERTGYPDPAGFERQKDRFPRFVRRELCGFACAVI